MSATKYTKEQIAAAGEDYKKNGRPGMSPENVDIIKAVIQEAERIKAVRDQQEVSEEVKPSLLPGENKKASVRQPEALQTVPVRAQEEDPTGFPTPSLTKESLKKKVEDLKFKIDVRKDLHLKGPLATLKSSKASADEKAKAEAKIAQINDEIEKLEKDLKEAERDWESAPPEPIVDENQPWFGKVYANCTGYLVQNSAGDFQLTNETNTGRRLREMGISNKPDTATTSPLDRVFNILQDRYHVDWYGALAGYRPGLIEQGGNRVLITKGPRLRTPVKGEFPTIQKFMEGIFRDKVKFAHAWNHLAVIPLYHNKITQSHIFILAGPINSGKSVYQNLIVTPMLGGRVARPYPHMIGRTDFNEDWFESEHLMCEDETPPRDYETQQRFAAELKKFPANEYSWHHGKGKKAMTLAPFWRVTVSVNNNPENLRAIPMNDETMKDKMIVLEVYPDATVELVESLGGQDNFASKLREELPAYLYWLLYEYQIPSELKDTRFKMISYQDERVRKAVEETSPYMDLLEVMEKVFAGYNKTERSVLEILNILQDNAHVPKGVVPLKPITLGRYLTELSKITNAIEKKETKKGIRYILTFPGKRMEVVLRGGKAKLVEIIEE